MITINEEKWADIKHDFLDTVDYEFSEEPLMIFNNKNHQEEEIGIRETYEFSRNDMDYMVIVDKDTRFENPVFKLSIKFRDKDGAWKDSAALESNFEE